MTTQVGCVIVTAGEGGGVIVTFTEVELEHPETGSKTVTVYVPDWVAVPGFGVFNAKPGPFHVMVTPKFVEFPINLTVQSA